MQGGSEHEDAFYLLLYARTGKKHHRFFLSLVPMMCGSLTHVTEQVHKTHKTILFSLGKQYDATIILNKGQEKAFNHYLEVIRPELPCSSGMEEFVFRSVEGNKVQNVKQKLETHLKVSQHLLLHLTLKY